MKEIFVSSNSSRISSTFSARSEAALIAEKSTLERRQAIQMDEYRLESEIQKSRMEQDRARLELRHRKEQLRLETQLLRIQAKEIKHFPTSSKNADMQIRSDIGITSTQTKDILSSKRISKSLPILMEQEVTNKISTQSEPKKSEVNSDNEENKTYTLPVSLQPPKRLADNDQHVQVNF